MVVRFYIVTLLLRQLFANLILNSSELGNEDTNNENNLHRSVGNPSNHGSQVQQQSVLSDTTRKFPDAIDGWHKKKELALYRVPSYSNGGALFS